MTTDRLLTLLRALSAEHFVSGTHLAARLGLSRASVHLDLQAAEQLGVAIERVPGRGYRLRDAVSWLDEQALRSGMGANWQVDVVPVIDSSNAELLRRPLLPWPCCLAAELQTAGRGRRGRQWLGSAGGSLLFSVAWPFNSDISRLSGLSLVVGLAVAEALEHEGVPGVQLKWPNDLVVDFCKLGGVLIEVQAEVNSHCRAIIGIGLNIRLPEAVCALIDQPVTDVRRVAGSMPDRNRLLLAILHSLERWLPRLLREGFASCRPAWEQRHAFQGRQVRLSAADGRLIEGRVLGVDDGGQLLLETPQGIQALHAGELSLRAGEAG